MLKQIIWLCAFIGLVLWFRYYTPKEDPQLKEEMACTKNAVTGNDMKKCFDLMDKHKAEREKGST